MLTEPPGVAQSYPDLLKANFPSFKITDPRTEMSPRLCPRWGWTTHTSASCEFQKAKEQSATRVLKALRLLSRLPLAFRNPSDIASSEWSF